MRNGSRAHIISASYELFNDIGLQDITVDDLVDRLNLSKRSFYRYFNSKDDVIEAMAMNFIKQIQEGGDRIRRSGENPMNQLVNTVKWMASEPATITPLLLADLQKHFPEFGSTVFKARYLQILAMIEEGQRQGIVREEINSAIFALMCCHMINGIAENGFLRASHPQNAQVKFLVDLILRYTTKAMKLC